MATDPPRRKVLVLSDERSIENLRALVKKVESRKVVTGSGQPVLATLNRKLFDSVVLDLRCSNRRLGGRGHGIGDIWPSRVGKVLVLTAEVNGPKSLEMVERYLFHRPSLGSLLHDLASRLRTLLHRSPSPNQV